MQTQMSQPVVYLWLYLTVEIIITSLSFFQVLTVTRHGLIALGDISSQT